MLTLGIGTGVCDGYNTTFLPSSITGLVAWFRLNTGITVTGAGVSQWSDQSGAANHLLQATDANRPQKQGDGSISFAGGAPRNEYLKCTAFTLNQPFTVAMQARQITWTSGNAICDGNTLQAALAIQTGTTPELRLFAGATLAGETDWTVNTYQPLFVCFNGASSYMKVAANASVSGNAGAQNAAGFTLAAQGDGSAFGNIQVKELCIYNVALAAADLANLNTYLGAL